MRHDFNEVVNRRGTGCKKWDTYGADVIPMWIADTDFKCPQEVVDAMVKRAEHGVYGYPDIYRTFEESVAHWQRTRFGWNVDPSWVEYTPAVIPAIVYAMQAFTIPGDNVVVQMPAYHPFHDIIPNNGRHIARNQMILNADGTYSLDFDDLERLLSNRRTKMLLLCNPHNPTGRCFTFDELSKIAELCIRYDVFVVSDEIHSDIVYKGHKHIPFGTVSEEISSKCVVCVNPSKTFNIAGVRTGAAIIPNKEVHNKFYAPLENLKAYGRTIFGTLPIEICYTQCSYYADELVEYLEDNLNYLKKYIKDKIPKLKVGDVQATYLIWLDCKRLNLSPTEMKNFFIKEAKVAMNEGSSFGPGGEGYMRMNIACTRATLEEALMRIEHAVNRMN